jgi:hypothetical protein
MKEEKDDDDNNEKWKQELIMLSELARIVDMSRRDVLILEIGIIVTYLEKLIIKIAYENVQSSKYPKKEVIHYNHIDYSKSQTWRLQNNKRPKKREIRYNNHKRQLYGTRTVKLYSK